MKSRRLKMLGTMLGISLSICLSADALIKDGQKIAFLGDSITQMGTSNPTGYVNLVMKGLAANSIKAVSIPAGISGHKSNQMLARLDNDVINKHPDFMTLSCGVNDVWHGEKGVPLDKYKENITAIVDKSQAANVKVIILTATMIKENPENTENKKLAAYNDFLRELAKEKKCILVDLNAEMQTAVKKLNEKEKTPYTKNFLTTDGVHMIYPGNKLMAENILKGLGLDDKQIEKAEAAWADMPGAYEINLKMQFTEKQWAIISRLAEEQKTNPNSFLYNEYMKVINSALAK